MNDKPQITPEQAKAARALLGLGAKDVCRQLGITPQTLHRAEFGKSKDGRASHYVFEKIRRLYETAGVEFTDCGQPGVRLSARVAKTENQ
jgi:transcriptional regulator with XRE-family HTH domain